MDHRNAFILLILSLFLISACGPDTIFLRPGLDTPAQHVKNGHSLLSCGKIDAANAEFLRATTLDGNYVPAFVGIALVQGHRGNIDEGVETLNQAKGLTTTAEEEQAVDQGYRQLHELQSKDTN
jgi:hypothetical protein